QGGREQAELVARPHHTPNVSRHCLITSGIPLVISSTLGWIVFTSAADFAPLSGFTSGRIDSLKCSTQICEASVLSRYSMNSFAAFRCRVPFGMPDGAMISTEPSGG